MSIICEKNMQKSVSHKNFTSYCKDCDYSASSKFLWEQHCKTKKHKKREMLINAHDHKKQKLLSLLHYCNHCGKGYSHIQSLNRHKKICANQNLIIKEKEKNNTTDIGILDEMFKALMKHSERMLTENQEMREMVKEMLPKIGNNNTTINNKFNLQVFLNEECKDAINLTDFIDTLTLELSDLDETRQNGYVSGMTNIFVRGLKQLDLCKRPIHCSDIKREILYIKDNDTWEKDSEEKDKLKEAINKVAKKQIDQIKDWEADNPNWNKTDKGKNNYIEMVKNVTNNGTIEDNTDNRIIKTIAKEVIIEK
jgi:hypothetical protein